MVDVNLLEEDGREFLEIVVPAYSNPISYKGEYCFRSGSTTQMLKGAALVRFLLRKQGRHWDAVPVPQVTVKELSKTAMATFRSLARQSRRLDLPVLREPADMFVEFRYPDAVTSEAAASTTPKTTPKALLEHLKARPDIGRKELAELLGITPDGVKYHLNRLRSAGKIRHLGAARGGRWEVLE